MTGADHSLPALRLINGGVAPAGHPLPGGDGGPGRRGVRVVPGYRDVGSAPSNIARENRAAAALSATDARWVFAVRVASSLEGGALGALPPEKRQKLLKLATQLGLRAFDANLIIAIVQDGARTGEGSLGVSVAERVELVRPVGDATPRWSPAGALAASIALGLLLFLLLVAWVGA
jgi:hypothetical protein